MIVSVNMWFIQLSIGIDFLEPYPKAQDKWQHLLLQSQRICIHIQSPLSFVLFTLAVYVTTHHQQIPHWLAGRTTKRTNLARSIVGFEGQTFYTAAHRLLRSVRSSCRVESIRTNLKKIHTVANISCACVVEFRIYTIDVCVSGWEYQSVRVSV